MKPESGLGTRADKIVRKVLADGTVKEYRYSRDRKSRKRPALDKGAIRQLAELYTKSPEFMRLSLLWRRAKMHHINILEDELGFMTKADLEDRRSRAEFYELRDRHAALPHKADKLMDALKGMLGWAYERGRIEHNHALGLGRLTSTRGTRSDIVWTEDHEAIATGSFSPALSQAWRLALYTGARQADICSLRWDQYKDEWLTFLPAKTRGTTGIKVNLPVYALPPFQALMDELSRGTEFVLTTDQGNPWQVENLRVEWRWALARTDLADSGLRWHDIRGSCLSRLADAGCTDSERAAVSGHSLGGGSKLGDYTARSRQLALNAYTKWARFIAAPPTVVRLETALDNRKG